MKLLPLAIFVASPLAVVGEGVSYNRDARPILSDKCFYCHGTDPDHRKGDRRLDVREAALADLDGIRAIVPGKPEESELIIRILSDDEGELMPPPKSHKALTPVEKETLRRWVAEGAKYEPHWAFVAPARPVVPEGVAAIDYFIGRRLQQEGLSFSHEAEKGALLRRVTLDLTGLPPTLAELDAFEKDTTPDAYERAVDRLLASPRYGEQMAMPWLDAARYADTNGYQMDAYRMQWPWRDWVARAFNDNMPFDQFTIQQLAGDLLPNPTQDQLIATGFNRNHMLNAEGGTIPEENRTKNVFDRVETTGTVWLGLTMNCTQCHDHKFDPLTQRDYYGMFALFNQLSEPGNVNKRIGKKPFSDIYDSVAMVESPYILLASAQEQQRLDEVATKKKEATDRLNLVKPLLHPHFARWVEKLRASEADLVANAKDEKDQKALLVAKIDDYNDANTRRVLGFFFQRQWPHVVKKLDDTAVESAREIFQALVRVMAEEEALLLQVPHVMIMRDDKPRETRILKRGNYETPGDPVTASVPAFLPALPKGAKPDRLALARWFVAPENPLMARVTVNRFWQQFFGTGLVKTPDDFGLQGALPSHPELLDWLAVEFRESGWNVKRLARMIVTSRAYRQRAVVSKEMLARDPENVLLARGPRFRLDARALRDQALALSGLLVEKRGGPAVMPYQPPGIWEEMSFDKNRYFQGTGEDLHRRSLYTFWRRSVAPASFFDVPARQTCVVKPYRTSTPLHALTTLNDTTYVEAARVWAEKLLMAPSDDSGRLALAFRAATARAPEPRELASLSRTLQKSRDYFAEREGEARKLVATGEAPRSAKLAPADHAAWTTLCLLVLNLDETLNR